MKVEVSGRCAAPPEAVFAWVADPARHIRMLPDGVRNARVLENGDMACELSGLGVQEQMVVRIVETEPPRRVFEERVDGRRRGSTEFRIEPDGEGSLVTIACEIELPRLLAGLARGPVESGLRSQLRSLDALSASGA
jgi:carbon monoxide dehydrogenase subunit G